MDGPWVRMRRGYTSSYTSWGDPTHPLDPRKIFFSIFLPLDLLSTEQTVRATASTSEDLIWATTAFSFHVLLSSPPPLLPRSSPSSLARLVEPLSSILIRWFIISTARRERYLSLDRRRGCGGVRFIETRPSCNRLLLRSRGLI